MTEMNPPAIGTVIHGFADGMFGRDSYQCRRVEAVGSDWIVTRSPETNVVELISLRDFHRIDNPNDRTYCYEECQ